MPFNGTGTFQRVRNWVADATAGIKIRADYHDAEDDNFAAGLSNCITRDGQTIVTQNIPMNSKRLTGLADPINPQDAATKALVDTKLAAGGGTMTGAITINNGAVDGAELSWASQGFGSWNIDNVSGTMRFFQGSTVAMTLPDGGGSVNVVAALTAGSISASGNINSSGSIGAAANVNGNNVTAGAGGFSTTGPLTISGASSLQGVTATAINATTLNTTGNIGTTASLFASGNLYLSGGNVYLNHGINNRGLRLNGDDSVDVFGPGTISIRPDARVRVGRGILSRSGYSGVDGTVSYTLDFASGAFYLKADDTGLGFISVTSDYRVKKDIIDLASTWDAVKTLRPITYTQAAYGELFQADDIERWGFIAHELQDTLIHSAATANKDDPDHIQSPNPWPVIAALTKALQEAMARIEALEGTR